MIVLRCPKCGSYKIEVMKVGIFRCTRCNTCEAFDMIYPFIWFEEKEDPKEVNE